MTEHSARVALALLLVALAACTTAAGRADRDWRRGDVAAAAAGYERILAEGASGADREQALLRLAIACTMPGSPVADPARARGLLRELIADYPAGELRHEAGALLALLDQADAAAADVAAARQERERLETEIGRVEVDLAVKETTLARLRNNLNEAEAELGRLRHALEELKRIDLQRRP